jgi:methionyl aminopeptidase
VWALRAMGNQRLTGKELEAYRRSGKIASHVRNSVLRMVKPGERILRICEETEGMIRRSGGTPAFPTNVSINHVAAHYTSPPNDETLFPEDGLVKVDLGVSVDGYLSDTAETVDLSGKEAIMVETVKESLRAAISTIKEGVGIGVIGETVSRVVSGARLKPISNLSGHSLARNRLHSGTSVYNIPMQQGHIMREGEVYAIEPFVTKKDGKGFVKDTRDSYIFSCSENTFSPRDSGTSEEAMFKKLRRRFGSLPFALRWLDPEVDEKQLRKLVKMGMLIDYPVLVEAGKKIVAQAEHTVLVKKYGCEVLTD